MNTPRHSLSLFALVLCALPVHAQWSSDASSHLAVADGAAEQVQPQVRPTADGGSYVSWYDSDPSGSPAFGYDVSVQRLDSSGNELFAHGGVLVADRGFSSTQDYGLAVDTNGNALLAFRDDRFTGTQVTAAKIDGTTGALVWGANGVQLTNTTGFLASPKIAGTSDGNVVVGWSDDSDLHLMKLDGTGTPLWASDVVLSPASNNYGISDLRASDAGGVIVSFVLYGNFATPRHLFAQKLDTDGNLLWGANHVAVFDGGSLQFGNFPDFVVDDNGGAVFGWYGVSPLESYAQRVLANGTEAFPHNGVSASTDGTKERVSPSIAFDAAAGEVVLFCTEEQNFQDGVRAQRYDATGNRLWTATGALVAAPGAAAITDVDALALDGDAQVFWISEPAFGQDRILGATLDSTGSLTAGPFDLSSTPAGKSRVQAALGTTGTAILAWQDDGSGSDDILAQNALPDGTLGGLASAVSRNGSGANTVCLTGTDGPILGQTWDVQVDTTGHPGATLSLLVIHAQPSSGTFIAAGEVLVNLGSSRLLTSILVTTGLDVHSFAVPVDVSFIGAPGFAQAAILGGGVELCNALDVVVGL